MNETTPSEIQTPGRHADTDRSLDTVDRQRERRTVLRTRHTQGLTKLMEQRSDLRGVHALADFVDDSVRWSA